MSEINQRIEEYIFREKALLDQLALLQSQKDDASTKLVTEGISFGVGEFATWLLESSRAGRYGRSLSKKYLDQKRKEQRIEQERGVQHQHEVTVLSLITLLGTISIWKHNINKPNSQGILAKLEKAQTFVRLSTRIRNTIKMLIDLTDKNLIYNVDISEVHITEEIIISPGKPYTAISEIKKILHSSSGFVKVIDPYVNEYTLDILMSVPENIPIMVITSYTGGKHKENRFIRSCKVFKKERPKFEIMKCDPTLIHDRFIITRNQAWSVGSSLKDIGKSLSMIKTLTQSNREKMNKFFDDLWKDSLRLY